ncbi:MAG: hypothetical protein Q4D14_06150 [Bacteroidales bacterium]|nr:hypothetical protein [Bacteroidales bacterium]
MTAALKPRFFSPTFPLQEVRVATGATFYHWRSNQLKLITTNDDNDYITTYDKQEGMITSVEIMKEDPNANTFQNVEYIPIGQYGPRLSSGYQHISQTRIMLKY